MRNTPFWWILAGIMFLIDLYVFQVVKMLSHSAGHRTKVFIYSGYWTLSAIAILGLLFLPFLRQLFNNARFVSTTFFAIIAGLFFAKLIASVFFLADDLRRGIQWVATRAFFSRGSRGASGGAEGISRSAFLSWAGTLVGGGLFGTLLYGFTNKYNYQVRKLRLRYENLPDPFRGMKVVHISDIHSGSFTDKKAVEHGVDLIMKQEADLILFTGDLVNNKAEEMENYVDVFGRLKAPMGIYSTLGNHDYGDYVHWDSPEEKVQNLERLKEIQHGMGWKLLMNEHVVLERMDHQISVIGIENWSAKANFPKYGDLKKAYAGAENYPFKILMSHDPSHWDAEVRKSFPDIDLMLSGHTHGMQFGVEIPGFRWSPVQYIYTQWAGLYEQSNQKLYVNRGYGFLAYPGRVGILPEITVIEFT